MKIYANMHTHSDHSDGGYTPEVLAAAAKKEGYGAVVLTDHDTISGYPRMRKACEALGLETVLGVEFSSPSDMLPRRAGVKLENDCFHICAYGFDPEHPGIKAYLKELGEQKTAQIKMLFDLAVEKGIVWGISWENVLIHNADKTWLTGGRIFDTMLAKGLLEVKDRVKMIADLRPLLKDTFQCQYRQEHEIIQLIRDAGGIPILAHPHEQLQYMDALMEMGIEGLEVSHRLLTEQEQEAATALALDKGLYISGGSDHAGLCSGYYERYPTPEQCPRYAPYLSFGTSKEYFEEIRDQKICR